MNETYMNSYSSGSMYLGSFGFFHFFCLFSLFMLVDRCRLKAMVIKRRVYLIHTRLTVHCLMALCCVQGVFSDNGHGSTPQIALYTHDAFNYGQM